MKFFPDGVKLQHTIFRKRSYNGELAESLYPTFGEKLICQEWSVFRCIWKKQKVGERKRLTACLGDCSSHSRNRINLLAAPTLSRWLKYIISQSGIKESFGGHSVR